MEKVELKPDSQSRIPFGVSFIKLAKHYSEALPWLGHLDREIVAISFKNQGEGARNELHLAIANAVRKHVINNCFSDEMAPSAADLGWGRLIVNHSLRHVESFVAFLVERNQIVARTRKHDSSVRSFAATAKFYPKAIPWLSPLDRKIVGILFEKKGNKTYQDILIIIAKAVRTQIALNRFPEEMMPSVIDLVWARLLISQALRHVESFVAFLADAEQKRI